MISSYDYTYNEIGNRTRAEDANSNRTTWTYDKTSQLLSEHRDGASPYHTTYTYDPLGNRITKEVATGTTTYTHDDANQMLTAEDVNGTTTYTYDANGNQATVEQLNNDLTTNSWSYENQMLQTELPDTTIFTSIYNSDEMRIAKIDTNDIVTSFIWDDQNYITELDDLDTVQVEYTYEPQQYGNLISQCRDTETSFHYYDALGSTTDLTDETEVVTDEWNYQAFGEENTRTGTNPNPYQWVGQVGYYHDEDRETHQIRARDYQSQVGRFLSPDPIGPVDSANLYQYAVSTPNIYIDPSGLKIIKYFCTGKQQTKTAQLKAAWPTPEIRLGPFFIAIAPGKGKRLRCPYGVKEANLTADELYVVRQCKGDIKCEEALSRLMNLVVKRRNVHFSQKCYKWADKFIEDLGDELGIDDPEDVTSKALIPVGGGIRISPKQLILPRRVYTAKKPWYKDQPSATDHAIFEVYFPGSKGPGAMFDIGSNTNLGHIGGDDHWFRPGDRVCEYGTGKFITPEQIKPYNYEQWKKDPEK